MKTLLGATVLTAMLLWGGSAFGAQVAIRIGPPPPPRVVRVLPASPGPQYMWVEGYWYPVGNHYKWHDGYWTRSPYQGALWVAPRYDGQQFFPGYWSGDRGRIVHDHRWDRDRNRDFRDRDRDRHH